jgi:hypothetical protein
MKIVAHWLSGLQYRNAGSPSDGAILVNPGVAAYDASGTPYYRVSPYLANLGVFGALGSPAPDRLLLAKGWVRWFLGHLSPQGVPYECYYRKDGSGETACDPAHPAQCDVNDATDSAAATFFLALEAFYRADSSSGKKDFFEAAGDETRIETVADALLSLQDSDGLTWAKADYRAKYLMDNCEAYAGLKALARLERSAYRDSERAKRHDEAAERIRREILEKFWDPASEMYRPSLDRAFQATDLRQWYPDMEAQLWPHLFGLVPADDSKTRAVLAALDETWNGTNQPDWAAAPEKINGGWFSVGAGYAALLAGDRIRAEAYLRSVKRLKFPTSAKEPGFDWPLDAGDAGWLLLFLTKREASHRQG